MSNSNIRTALLIGFFVFCELYWLLHSGPSDNTANLRLYEDQIHLLKVELNTSHLKITSLQNALNVLTKATNALTSSNEVLTSANEALTTSNEVLTTSNDALTTSNDALTTSNEVLTASNKALTDTNTFLLDKHNDIVENEPLPEAPPGQSTQASEEDKLKNSQEAFEDIYTNARWGERDDLNYGNGSGLGSAPKFTIKTREIIREIVKKYKVKKMMDAPCGAMVWMPTLLENLTAEVPGFEYLGVDVVRGIIKDHRKNFAAHSNWRFSVCDISYCNLPYGYDLIFTRDALQHLPYAFIFKYLQNIKETDATYLLAGSYNEHENQDIQTGKYFSINLQDPPFSLPPPLEKISEGYFEPFLKPLRNNKTHLVVIPEKYLLLWRVEDLRKWNPPQQYLETEAPRTRFPPKPKPKKAKKETTQA